MSAGSLGLADFMDLIDLVDMVEVSLLQKATCNLCCCLVKQSNLQIFLNQKFVLMINLCKQ